MADVARPAQDYLVKLRNQLQFLARSADTFDAGEEQEAERLAHHLRLLLHDTSKSRSLLAELGVKDDLRFVDTAAPQARRFERFTGGLWLLDAAQARWEPPFDWATAHPLPFRAWWHRPVAGDNAGHKFSRRDLVLTVANQDGGSHVDEMLPERYFALSRLNSQEVMAGSGEDTVPPSNDPVAVAVRQVAHEVERTLRGGLAVLLGPGFPQRPERRIGFAGPAFSGMAWGEISAGRNDPCPCRSGMKFKRCCDA